MASSPLALPSAHYYDGDDKVGRNISPLAISLRSHCFYGAPRTEGQALLLLLMWGHGR